MRGFHYVLSRAGKFAVSLIIVVKQDRSVFISNELEISLARALGGFVYRNRQRSRNEFVRIYGVLVDFTTNVS